MKAPEYIQANGFVAEVKRTRRKKTASIKINDGVVSIVVPFEIPETKISQLLHDKKRWIKEKLNLHRNAQVASSKQYISGESFSYLGRNYRLKVNKGDYSPAKLANGRFCIALRQGTDNPELIKDSLSYWFKHHAEIKLTEKAERYSKIVGVEYQSIGIKSYKSRWGSCSIDGVIDFNWKIIMAPNRIVDYVVVHELCHLIHHDHSPKFWKEVERVMPDYAECKAWLRENGVGLEL